MANVDRDGTFDIFCHHELGPTWVQAVRGPRRSDSIAAEVTRRKAEAGFSSLGFKNQAIPECACQLPEFAERVIARLTFRGILKLIVERRG